MLFALWFLIVLLGCVAQSFVLAQYLFSGFFLYLVAGSLCFLLFSFSESPLKGLPEFPAKEPERDFFVIPFAIGFLLFLLSLWLVVTGSAPEAALNATRLSYAVYGWLGFLVLTAASAGKPVVDFFARQDRRFYVPLGLLLLLALGAGLFRLTSVPPTVHGDEGMVGLHARMILEGRIATFFSSSWYEIPQFFFFLPSAGMYLFGDNVFGLRMSAVILGTLTVIPFFILARSWWGTSAAVFASLMMILNHYFLHLMHSGVHYVQAAFFATCLLCLWYFANKKQSLSLCLFAGVNIGLGLMSYQANHLLPVLWAVSQIWLLVLRRISLRWFAVSLATPLLMASLVISPLILHESVRGGQWIMFQSRASSVVAWTPDGLKHLDYAYKAGGNTGAIWREQGRRAFLSTVLYSDTSLQYGGMAPFLDRFAAVLFVFAAVGGCFRFFDIRWSVPLGWTAGILLAGGVLTVDPPFFPRLSGISTILYLPIAGVLAGALRLSPQRRYFRTAGLVFLTAYAALAGAVNVHQYFQRYAEDINTRNIHYAQTRLARYMLERGPQDTYYIFGGGHFSSQSGTVMFMAKGYRFQDVDRLDAVDDRQPAVLVVHGERTDIQNAIRQRWPDWKEKTFTTPSGERLFITFTRS